MCLKIDFYENPVDDLYEIENLFDSDKIYVRHQMTSTSSFYFCQGIDIFCFLPYLLYNSKCLSGRLSIRNVTGGKVNLWAGVSVCCN